MNDLNEKDVKPAPIVQVPAVIAPITPHVPIVNGQLAPTDFDGLYRVADIMSQSGLVPAAYTRQPAKIFVAIQMGMELGLSPMASLQNIAVINGNPSLWGDAVLGIVSGSGILEDFKEEESGTFPNDDYKYICTAKRKGRETPIIREFSIADAKQANLFGSNKDNWQKYPKRMIQMRARSKTLRDGFPDLLKGIKVAEEAMDYEPIEKPGLKNDPNKKEEPKLAGLNPDAVALQKIKKEEPELYEKMISFTGAEPSDVDGYRQALAYIEHKRGK